MSASAAESNVIRVSNQKEFEEAIARVNKDSDSEYTIELTADFSVNGFSITSPHKTTILGSGHTLTMGVGGSVSVSKGGGIDIGFDGRQRPEHPQRRGHQQRRAGHAEY